MPPLLPPVPLILNELVETLINSAPLPIKNAALAVELTIKVDIVRLAGTALGL
jgi:hypothetical protein